MAERVRTFDWGGTVLGPMEGWPRALKVAVGICLSSRFPMFVWWGPGLINIYNDAYAPMLGKRHPAALGRPARDSWEDIWDVVGPQAEQVMTRGEATWNERVLLVMERNGYWEDTWFTWSYSPIPDDEGGIGGVFCAVTEETGRVLAERERDRQAEERRRAEERARGILDSITDGFFALDGGWRFTYTNGQAERILGREPGELIGLEIWAEYPGLVGSEFERVYRQAAGERVAGEVTAYYPDHDRWYAVHAYPAPGGGISVYFRDVSEAKRAERTLREAKEAAEEANRAKDRFLAVLSHELRTPLSPVLLSVAAMARDPQVPEGVREELGMVRRNVELEARLIDDLLDLSRVVNGKMRIDRRVVGVHEIVRHALATCAAEAQAKGLAVRLELGARGDAVSGDAARLQQVFWNLLNNAIKFTPEGGEVVVSTEGGGAGGIRVSVRDTGEGIPAGAVGRIFDAFVQVEGGSARRHGGLGLGLAICKAIVAAHGGNICAASEGEGRGATFTVELPLAHGVGAEVAGWDGDGRAEEVGEGAEGLRVLLVEDHADTARVLARLLKMGGHRVRVGHSVAEGLALAGGEAFDLVVSDVGLPDGTGYELMREVGERYGLPGIAMTGYGMEEDLRRGREAGFREYLVKPINVTLLEQAIRRVARAGE